MSKSNVKKTIVSDLGDNMLKEMLENVKRKSPLVHNITNYVTVNDCANILLACGASPIMADELDEVEEITSICSGLNINIGTLNKRRISDNGGNMIPIFTDNIEFDKMPEQMI